MAPQGNTALTSGLGSHAKPGGPAGKLCGGPTPATSAPGVKAGAPWESADTGAATVGAAPCPVAAVPTAVWGWLAAAAWAWPAAANAARVAVPLLTSWE